MRRKPQYHFFGLPGVCACLVLAGVSVTHATTTSDKFFTDFNALREKYSRNTAVIINKERPESDLAPNWISSQKVSSNEEQPGTKGQQDSTNRQQQTVLENEAEESSQPETGQSAASSNKTTTNAESQSGNTNNQGTQTSPARTTGGGTSHNLYMGDDSASR